MYICLSVVPPYRFLWQYKGNVYLQPLIHITNNRTFCHLYLYFDNLLQLPLSSMWILLNLLFSVSHFVEGLKCWEIKNGFSRAEGSLSESSNSSMASAEPWDWGWAGSDTILTPCNLTSKFFITWIYVMVAPFRKKEVLLSLFGWSVWLTREKIDAQFNWI